MQNLRSSPFLFACLLLIVSALAYSPGLGGGFIFDDYNNIVLNSDVQMESVDVRSLQRAASAFRPGEFGRPLATLSFAFDHYLGGKEPRIYKTTNLLVHLVNALLVFLLVRRLLSWRGSNDWHPWACFAIALAWAVHPLLVSTVLYVVQRMEMLATTFVLLSILAYLAGRARQIEGSAGWHWLIGSGMLAAAGLLSKESAVAAPLFTLTLELTLLRFGAKSAATTRMLHLGYAAILLTGAVVFFGYLLPRYATAEAYAIRDFNAIERLMTQPRVLMMHLGQMLLPVSANITFYYDTFPVSRSLLVPWTTLASVLGLTGMAAGGWWLRARAPLASLGIFWFLVAHALTSNVINLEMVFEHRNYFALLGVLLVVAEGVRRLPMRDGPGLKVLAISVALLVLGGLTTLRAATWGNPVLLAVDLAAKNPNSPRASNDLATVYADLSGGDPNSRYFRLAMQELVRASRMPTASPLPEQGLILLCATTGQPVEDAWWASLIAKVERQPIGPEQAMAVTGLMQQFNKGVPMDVARLGQAYQTLLGRTNWPGYMYAIYGDFALNHLDEPDLADRMFVIAVTRNPSDTDFAERVLATLITEGHSRQAALVAEAMRAQQAAPDPTTRADEP